jgi:hypothetical protein
MGHECGHGYVEKRPLLQPPFFFDLRTIFDRKKGNDVMNNFFTISQINISNKLISKIFLHIFIVMGTLKWL